MDDIRSRPIEAVLARDILPVRCKYWIRTPRRYCSRTERTRRQLQFGYPWIISESFKSKAYLRNSRIGQSEGEPTEHAKVSMVILCVGYSTREKERRWSSASAAVHTISRILTL